MDNKSLAELAYELADLVNTYEHTSAQLLSHPVFPEMPNAIGVQHVLESVVASLRMDLQRSAASVQTELDKLRQAMHTMDNRRDLLPPDQQLN
jgi:hypothetical protein